jgi:hypothetical protein
MPCVVEKIKVRFGYHLTFVVPKVGVEPTRVSPREFESRMFASFITSALI